MTKDNKVVLRNKKGDLRKLVILMNKQNKRFIPPFEPILQAIEVQNNILLILLSSVGLKALLLTCSANPKKKNSRDDI